MDTIRFSVVIRTTGHAGEKYARLLRSISALEPQPEEVIVVLPEGAETPAEKLGWERFCYCPKGMVRQRLYGLEQCRSPYALFSDDDIAFGQDFVQKLHQPLAEGVAKLAAGPLLEFFPVKGKRALLSAVMGNTAPMLPWRQMYVRVLRSTGYSYNRKIDTSEHVYYPSQSLAWTCFYGETAAMRAIHMEEEGWLDSHGYAAMDDQTMFYKACLKGIPTVVVSDAPYQHLNAQTSTKVSANGVKINYSIGFNRTVFWRRFILETHNGLLNRLLDRFCFGYQCVWAKAYSKINVWRGKKRGEDHEALKRGMRDARAFLTSEEYRRLPKVLEEK